MEIVTSSGNVFEDLGLRDAAELLEKADMAIEIGRILDERRLSTAQAAGILRTSEARITHLRRGRLDDFTIAELLDHLSTLNQHG
jgi:predicted XRE-type DNA-binding protein